MIATGMRCGECAAEVAVTARVCSRCGARIVGQPSVVADTVVADTAQDGPQNRPQDEPQDRPTVPWQDKGQVVSLRRSRLEPAAVEVAIVIRTPDGRYVHRRGDAAEAI